MATVSVITVLPGGVVEELLKYCRLFRASLKSSFHEVVEAGSVRHHTAVARFVLKGCLMVYHMSPQQHNKQEEEHRLRGSEAETPAKWNDLFLLLWFQAEASKWGRGCTWYPRSSRPTWSARCSWWRRQHVKERGQNVSSTRTTPSLSAASKRTPDPVEQPIPGGISTPKKECAPNLCTEAVAGTAIISRGK